MRYSPKRKISLPLWTKKKTFIAFFLLLGIVTGSNFAFYCHKLYLLPFFLLLILLFSIFAMRKGKTFLGIYLLASILSFSLQAIPIPSQREEKCEITGIVIETKKNYFFLQSGIHRYYVYEKDNEREIGDYLFINGKKEEFIETKYESRFSFQEYLCSRGIKYSLRAYSIIPRFKAPLRLRNHEKQFLSHFDERTRSLLDGLLFDRKDSQSEFLVQATSLGILYLFSSSGIYLGIALRLIEGGTRKFLSERGTKYVSFVTLILLFPFYIVKLGYYRVFLSRIIRAIYQNKEGGIDSLGKTSLVGIILYLFSFRSPLRSAYLLGIGISLNHAFLGSVISRIDSKRKRKIVSSISFHCFLLPNLVSNSSIHLFSYFYSLFLPFLVFPFRFIAILSFLTIPFVSFLNGYASLLNFILSLIEKIDIIIPIGGGSNVYLSLLYYCFYYALFYLSECGFSKAKKRVPLLFVVVLILRAMPISLNFSDEVTFINVGQGDAILIREKGKSVLLDTGGVTSFDLGKEVDLSYLYKRRIYHLDAVIASHGDYDHIGAYASLKKLIPIKNYYDSPSSFPLKIGNMEFRNLNLYGGNEENDKSLVLSLKHLGKKWLFMGDATKRIEEKIIQDNPDLRCDVLKVGHHGSNTSTSELFLKTVQPKVAIISVGARNNFGHPDPTTLAKLKANGIAIRRTDLEGTISYTSYLNSPIKF